MKPAAAEGVVDDQADAGRVRNLGQRSKIGLE
jgi:hypothetical protein